MKIEKVFIEIKYLRMKLACIILLLYERCLVFNFSCNSGLRSCDIIVVKGFVYTPKYGNCTKMYIACICGMHAVSTATFILLGKTLH